MITIFDLLVRRDDFVRLLESSDGPAGSQWRGTDRYYDDIKKDHKPPAFPSSSGGMASVFVLL